MRTLACLLLVAAALPAQRLGHLALRDPQGRLHRVLPPPGRELTVVVFTGVGCPISNAYAPVYRDLAERFGPRGVRFFAIHSVGEPAQEVAAHAREYGFAFPVLMDPDQRAARALGARVTPEAFLVDADGRVRYAGRIDDRYGSRTAKRQTVRRHDLALAIEAVLEGREVEVARTRAFGCAISARTRRAATTRLTYHRDVAPILQRRCQECHREGQVAPFSLNDYEDAVSWGEEIVEATATDLMPPWKECGPRGRFAGDRRLEPREKRVLAEWVAGGMPEGDPADAPPPARWPQGWKLGTPDLVLEMPEEYTVGAAGRDEYVCFVIPTGLTGDRYLKAAEFQPGNPRVVHHVIGYLDTRGRGRRLDAKDPRPGYRRFGGPGFLPSGAIGGWAPGNDPRLLPEGVGRPVPRGADLVLQVHYFKTGKVEKDRTRVGLYFARPDERITHHVVPLVVQGGYLRIPAGAARHQVRGQLRLPTDVEVLAMMPHMHLLGRRIRLEAELPDGSLRELLRIDDWDFDWQLTYYLREPLRLPKGTVLAVEAVYDNSENNPDNPSHPPRTVYWGERTTDEMCYVFLYTMVEARRGATMLSWLRGRREGG